MTVEEILRDLRESIYSLKADTTFLNARCDALQYVITKMAQRAGYDEAKVAKLIEDATNSCHQTRLEAAEKISPEFGAKIDTRPNLPDLPDF